MIIRSALLALLASTSFQAASAEVPRTTSHKENATSLLAISPIFSQLVAFQMPVDFHVVNEQTSAHAYIREAVPTGETAEQWSRMITVTGYKNVAANPGVPPVVLLNTIAGGFKRVCPDTVSVGDLGNPPIDGYPAAFAFVACGTTSDGGRSHSEAALVVAIKGTQDYYTIQWAERGPAQSTPIVFDEQHWLGRLKQLMPVFLCARIPGEEAPYPSCVSRLSSHDGSAPTGGNNAAKPSASAPSAS
ncbi:hypothetical protein [Rhodanobacter sp. T12-5]|uniref:hypothetical protein n=1 Tax=Rhodanobacter sp. T12-5 TaxID=2024611 RepID=UPI0011EF35B2|nr:hypothetical protein [Rhodanobacter sp. T12-5]KAA0071095.1 hypothetical protein CIW53_07260 [Rhodanobacter sp. T12-5]